MHWFSTSTFLLSRSLQRALAQVLEERKRGIKRESYAEEEMPKSSRENEERRTEKEKKEHKEKKKC